MEALASERPGKGRVAARLARKAGWGAHPQRRRPGFSEGEESADVYPRRAVSPTQPWSPQPPARCADAAVQTDVIAIAVAAWPSGLGPADAAAEPAGTPPPWQISHWSESPLSEVSQDTFGSPEPFEFPEPHAPGGPLPLPVGGARLGLPGAQEEGLVVTIPAGAEAAVARRRECGAPPLPAPQLHEFHSALRAMVARWPSVSGLTHAERFISHTTLAWIDGFHPNEEMRLNLMRSALRYIARGEDNHVRTGSDPDDAACDAVLERILGRSLAANDACRRAPFAGRRIGEAENPGPHGPRRCVRVCAPRARWRAVPRLLCATMALVCGVGAADAPGCGGAACAVPLGRARWFGRFPADGCREREPRRQATARWFGEFLATAKAVPRRPPADEAVWGIPRRRAGPRLAGTMLAVDAVWGTPRRCCCCLPSRALEGRAREGTPCPGRGLCPPRADRRSPTRVDDSALEWRDRWRPTGLPCPRRTAWGESDGLLATRVGEASIPGPAADSGQRTLRLAPGGLTLADSPDGAPGSGDLPPVGQSPRTPARAGVQRMLDFGSASSVPVPRTEGPAGDADEGETPGDVRSLLTEFGRLDVEASQPHGQVGARKPKRIRAVGGQACSACAQAILRGRWGYGCSGCAVAYCCAACRGHGFGTHECGATEDANAAPRR